MFIEQMNCQLKKSSEFTDNIKSFGLISVKSEDFSIFPLYEIGMMTLIHYLSTGLYLYTYSRLHLSL